MSRRRVRRAPPATCFAGGLPRHARPDWLGSERLAAWTNQTLASEEAYAPFGEAYAGAGAGEPMFTGKGQRLAAGTYDFPFRHYSPAQGRWLSPDPSGLAAVNPANPQSWNAYAYVASQPLTATDPLGLNWNYQNNTACAPLPGTQVFQGVPYACTNGGSEGEVQSVGVTATPLPGPPYWIPANLTGVPYCAANPLACMGPVSHPNGPGGGGGGGTGAGPINTSGTVGSRLACAEGFADGHSLAATLDISAQAHPIEAYAANALLGNSVSGALQFVQGLFGGHVGGTAAGLVTGGLSQGLPIPASGNRWAGGGLAGGLTDGVLNAATGGEEITTLTGTVAMDGLAAPIGLVKFAYDTVTFGVGLYRGCGQ